MRRFIPILLLLLAPIVFAAEKPKEEVVCVGDSITFGEGVPREQNFVSLLAAGNPRWDTINQGRSGWSTSDYLRQKNSVIPQVPADASIVMIMLGANDLRIDGHSDATVAKVVRQTGELATLIHGRAPRAKIVLLTPVTAYPKDLSPRLIKAHFGKETPEYLKRIGTGLEELARRRGYRCIDLYATVTPGHTIDGIHPNIAGHRQIADAILTAMQAGGK